MKKYKVLQIWEDNEKSEEAEDILRDEEGDENLDFTIKYISTYGWRGYYTAKAKNGTNWVELDSDWVTGNWSDAGENASDNVENKLDKIAEEQEQEGKKMVVVFLPTNDCFSTNYQIFIR